MARGQGTDCNAKEGNPFGPFWDTFSVDFVQSEFYGQLNYDVHHQDMARKWNNRYPTQKSPGRYYLNSIVVNLIIDKEDFICDLILTN
jgi:hypothetical protein